MKRKELLPIVMLSKKMPPCDATSDWGHMCDVEVPTDRDLRTLQTWIRLGHPEGAGTVQPRRQMPKWRLGTPEWETRLKDPFTIPAEGTPFWRVFRVKAPEWFGVGAFDIVPDSPKAIRQVVVAIADPAESRRTWLTQGSMNLDGRDLIGAWSPGYRPLDIRPRQIPLRSAKELLVQVMITPTGKPESGNLTIGFYRGRNGTATWKTLSQTQILLPPDRQLTIEREWTTDRPVSILAVHPEARNFARQVRVRAKTQDEPEKALLFILNWDTLWLGNYVLPRPARFPQGTQVLAAIDYDNGRHAPMNEAYLIRRLDPPPVRAGDGPRDEVFRVHLLVAPD
jgi:hypothetical protein